MGRILVFILAGILFGLVPHVQAQGKSREFLFTYGGTVTKLQPGQTARMWLPVPPGNKEQDVRIVAQKIPGKYQLTREKTYGNDLLYFEAKADRDGSIPFEVTYRVKRWEVKEDERDEKLEGAAELFLKADRKVPVGGKPLELIQSTKLSDSQYELGKQLFDVVNRHMTYSKKGDGWGQGDAVWACESGYGNCTDFHSLFIALARSRKVPAKFEIGFPLPDERGKGDISGYHCWAWFQPKGRGWIPVDISHANQVQKTDPKFAAYCFGNLTENRVVFSAGRDLVLSPPQAGGPVNFLIYPYVEVNGNAVPAENIQRRFSYEDVEGK
jgi:hypothetical protein